MILTVNELFLINELLFQEIKKFIRSHDPQDKQVKNDKCMEEGERRTDKGRESGERRRV